MNSRAPSRLLRLSCASLLLLALTACGGDEKRADPGVPGSAGSPPDVSAPVTTPGPQAAATPFDVKRVPVRWVDTPSPLDLANAKELDDPFAQEWELRRGQGAPVLPQPMWSVQVAEGGSAPRELYSSKRMISGLEWQRGGLSADFISTSNVHSAPHAGSIPLRWGGSLTMDLKTGAAREQWLPFPANTTTSGTGIVPPLPGPPRTILNLETNAQSGQQLVWYSSGAQPPAAPGGQPTNASVQSVYLLDEKGKARKLEGLPDVNSLPGVGASSWIANGKAIVASRGIPTGPFGGSTEVFFVPVTDGDALHLSGVRVLRPELRPVPPGTSAGHRALLVFSAGSQPDCCAGIAAVYDSNTHTVRQLGPVNIQDAYAASWPESLPDSVLMIGGLLDLKTGAVGPAPPQEQLYPALKPPASPSGRYTASVPDIDLQAGFVATPECKGLPHKLVVEDKQAGNTKTVLECNGGTMGFLSSWLDDDRVLVHVIPCIGGCDAQESSYIIVQVSTGAVTRLTEGFEEYVTVQPSPDKKSLILTGKKLRFYSNAGILQRSFDAPAGYTVESAVWSPDGASIAFILGPEVRLFGGP